MQGIGPGTILGGRYTVDDRVATYPGAERWTARDTILERAVVLFTVARSHPNAAAVLDAARRSAGLDNPRLARILDVGTTEDLSYIVEEGLDGAHSLSELLEAGPLPAPEVRRIAGEAALLLDLARHRGLHHQRLTPDLVLRTQDGDVKLRGLAVMAALAGVDHVDEATAAREDARAVVAIAYAGFTGRWPLPGASGGLPSAPQMAAHVAAPSEIAPGVPADLDVLCRLTFTNDQGPVTPGDFARQIAPWSPIPVLLPAMEATGRRERPGGSARGRDAVAPAELAATPRAGTADVSGPSPAESKPTMTPPQVAEGAGPTGAGPVKVAHRVPAPPPASPPADGATEHSGSTSRAETSGPADPATDQSREPATRPAAAAAGGATAVVGAAAAGAAAAGTGTSSAPAAAGTGPGTNAAAGAAKAFSTRVSGWSSSARDKVRDVTGDLRDRTDDMRTKRALAAEARAERQALEAERQERLQTAGLPAAEADSSTDSAAPGTETTVTAPRPDADPAPKQPAAASTPPDAPTSTGAGTAARTTAAGAAAAKLGSTAASAAGPQEPREPQRRPERPRPAPSRPTGGPIGRRDDADRLEPPVPLLPSSAAEPLTKDQSRMAIGILVGALVLALAFAVWGLSSMPSLPGLSSSDGSTLATATETPDAAEGTTGAEPESTSPNAPPAVSEPLTFTAAKDYDPLGDGAENPDRLPGILDGDNGTWWGSEGYRSSAFSNLKPGLGIVLDLGESSSVSEVTLELPGGATGVLYVTDDAGYFTDAKPLADDLVKAADFTGEGTVTTTVAEGSTGRYVIVWFTEISRDGDWYRARLAGASATS